MLILSFGILFFGAVLEVFSTSFQKSVFFKQNPLVPVTKCFSFDVIVIQKCFQLVGCLCICLNFSDQTFFALTREMLIREILPAYNAC